MLTLHSAPNPGNDAVSSQEDEEEENAEDLVDQRWARARYACRPAGL